MSEVEDDAESHQNDSVVAAEIKHKSNIPDDLIEKPAPETLPSLDRTLDAVLADINILVDGRSKDFLMSNENRVKLPVFPDQFQFSSYKKDRSKILESLADFDTPIRKKSFSEAALKEIQNDWVVEKLFEDRKLEKIMIQFFDEKRLAILRENGLLLSRWMRFSRTSADSAKLAPIFKNRQQQLRVEFKDAVHRYERLYENEAQFRIKAAERYAAEEAKRNRDERDGLAVLRDDNPEKNRDTTDQSGHGQVKSALPSSFGDKELPSEKSYNVADMTIYLRWLISTQHEKSEVKTFLTKAKTVITSDTVDFLQDYSLIHHCTSGHDLNNSLEFFEGLNAFIPSLPQIPPKIEDFFVEFDALVHAAKIESLIGQEDGRPFAYEVDHKFMDTIYDQCIELTMIPYDKTVILEEASSDNPTSGNGIGGYSGSLALDATIITLSTISGVSSKMFARSKMTKLRYSDWTHFKQIPSVPTDIENQYTEFLSNLIETDMELKMEHEMLLLADNDLIMNHLKSISRRVWEKAASVPYCRPINAKLTVIPQNREQKKETESHEPRHPKLFDHGLKIPSAGYEDRMGHILAEKRLAYGQILKANEDTKKLELEILNADASKDFDPSNYITPTVASVFAEHEMLAFFQLRYMHTRDFRIKILRQLNFFRSIEKRLVMDNVQIDHILSGKNSTDATTSALADMWNQQEFFDLSNKKDSSRFDKSAFNNEDTRTTVNDRIHVSDTKGGNFIYDLALDDLKKFDEEMIQILTAFINSKSPKDGHVDMTYLDDLRFRKADNSAEQPNVTFRNPTADRPQMILEFYEAYHDYHYSKIQLIHSYMEAYEHTIEISKAKELAQIIISIIQLKPIMNLEYENFSKSFVQAKTSLLLHSRLVEEMIRQITTNHRNWTERFQVQKVQTELDKKERDNYWKSKESNPIKKKPLFFSSLKIGLPLDTYYGNDDVQTVIMHHPSFVFGILEIIPGLHQVTEIWNSLKSCLKGSEMLIASQTKRRFNSSVAECCILKTMNKYWQVLADTQFRSLISKKGTILEPDIHFCNPYVPDAILKELYIPFDQTADGNFKSLEISLEARNYFNDPSFKDDGLEILYRLLKVLVLDYRLCNSWIEGENWRKIFEWQLIQGQIKRSNILTRFPSLKFDSTTVEAPKDNSIEDDREEDIELDVTDIVVDVEDDKNFSIMKFGSLAAAEVDESLLMNESGGGTSIEGILFLLRREGVWRLKKMLKAQIMDKYLFQSFAEVTILILSEFYRRIINLDAPFDNSILNNKNEEKTLSAADLQGLIPTIMNQKKVLRKIISNEYSKEYRVLVLEDIPDQDRDAQLKKHKNSLIEFYFNNMFQIVAQEIERAEFAKFMADFKCILEQTNFSYLLFATSPITKYSEFLSGLDTIDVVKSVMKQSAATQGLIMNGSSADRLSKLWYIPHITQILIGMARPDKPHKGPIDLNGLVYKNGQTYNRSFKVHSLIQEIFTLVSSISYLLLGNQKYSAAVSGIREADYVVNAMNGIKRDFQAQGENADYSRVLKGLTLRWQYWTLKWKYILATCTNCLELNMLHSDVENIEAQSKVANKSKKAINQNKIIYRNPLKNKERNYGEQLSLRPPKHILVSISPAAKQLCSFRVTEIEEDLEEQMNSAQSESRDDIKQKSKIDTIGCHLKTLRLQEEYLKLYLRDTNANNLTAVNRDDYFLKFKIRIIVPAIKLYQKGSGKNGLSTEFLLRDVNAFGSLENSYQPAFTQSDYDRNAVNGFEKCKQTILQNEIIRSFTHHTLFAAKKYYDCLTDERLGRLFRASDNIEINSVSQNSDLVFRLSDDDYNVKSEIFNEFLNDLYEATKEYMTEIKNQQKSRWAAPVGGTSSIKEDSTAAQQIQFDDKRIFFCKKNDLAKVVSKFAVRLNKWQLDRTIIQEKFHSALQAHLVEMFKSCEQIIQHQTQEKKDVMNNFFRHSRLHAHELALDAFTAMASMEVELAGLRKSKKIDEKRIRNKILDEYDTLVDELVREIAILRNRFREYQVSNFNEVMNIMAESKMEHLMTLENNENLTIPMRSAVTAAMKHDEELKKYQEQNFELKMTILKIRSMFIMKEQGAKSFFQSKLRTLSELNKETEAKLWDSFREGEARERALRKQLARVSKAKATVDVQNELLQSQLREEQDKPQITQVAVDAAAAAVTVQKKKMSDKVKNKYIAELESKLKRYDGINIESLIQELTNKTALAEELLQEKRDRERLSSRPGSIRRDSSRRGSSSLFKQIPNEFEDASKTPAINSFALMKSKAGVSAIVSPAKIQSADIARMSPAFGLSASAAAAEPVQIIPEHRSYGKERIGELEIENKALRRKLFLNGIALPAESKKSLAHPSARIAAQTMISSRGTTPSQSQSRPRTANTQTTSSRPITASTTIVDSRSTSRPMTALSRPRTAASQGGGILKNVHHHSPHTPPPPISLKSVSDRLPEISKKLKFDDQ